MRASSHHLKQIGLAAHNYHDTYAQFPAFSKSEKGRPLLSWRVMVLPFLEQAALYNEFHLDEPWDSDPTFDVQLTSILPEMFAGNVCRATRCRKHAGERSDVDRDGHRFADVAGLR